MFQNVGCLDLLVAVAPCAAFALVVAPLCCAARRPLSDRLFAAVALPMVTTSVLIVSAFRFVAVHNERHVLTERNIVDLAPLLLTAFMMWFDGRPRPRRIALLAVLAVAVALPALIPSVTTGSTRDSGRRSVVLWTRSATDG